MHSRLQAYRNELKGLQIARSWLVPDDGQKCDWCVHRLLDAMDTEMAQVRGMVAYLRLKIQHNIPDNQPLPEELELENVPF